MNQGAQVNEEWQAEERPAEGVSAKPYITIKAKPRPTATPLPEAPRPRRWPTYAIAAVLTLIAIDWVGALIWSLGTTAPAGALTPLRLLAWIGLASGPLTLLAVLGVLLLRSGRVETSAFSRAAARMREESESLGQMLALLTERIDAARSELGAHAGELGTLGEGAAERLGRHAGELRNGADAFAQAARTFDDATAGARQDLGVLLDDLPRAEAIARAFADRIRDSGAEADVRARVLAELLGELETRAARAVESTGGASTRLATQLDRIEASAAAADTRIGEAAGTMGRMLDAALEIAAEGVSDTRHVIESQSAALTTLVQQGRAMLDTAGDEALRALSGRLDELVARVDGIGTGLRGQELQARGLLTQLEQAIVAVEERFQALGDKGAEHTADLAESIVSLSAHADAIGRTLGQNSQSAETLAGRMVQVRDHAEASSNAITEVIPSALSRIRLHAEQSLQAIASAELRTNGLSGAASAIADRLAEADALLERQRGALDQVGSLAGERLQSLHDQTAALETLLAKADAEVRSLSEGATGQLVDALLRVRDTAAKASDNARDAISAAIPRAAQRLSESAARAMTAALADVGKAEVEALGSASGQAVEAARAAAERLTRHLLVIAETSTAIEARIEANRAETETHDEATFARSVSLLIEALNSTAIDLSKLFSTDVTDEQWKAYLRGDRGVFTRRAVRLLERAEAGAIAERYSQDEAFAELVNRYIHDFEALIRRVMATRDGEAIATTMLSSDAGKLYVALAQAIERLRR